MAFQLKDKQPHNRPVATRMLQRLETLETAETNGNSHGRWMLPYADLLTLLLGFFLVLFASTQVDSAERKDTIAQLQQQLTQKQHRIEQLEARVKDLPDLPINSLSGKLAGEPDMAKLLAQHMKGIQGVQLLHQEQGMVISLQDNLLFPNGSAQLTPQARQTLDRVAKVLRQTPHPIRVEGHTDNTPIKTEQYPSNWELSTARATTILRYLAQQHQIPADRLSAAGYGEYKPVTQNSSIEGKQKNRRVDIVIMNGQTTQSGNINNVSDDPLSRPNQKD